MYVCVSVRVSHYYSKTTGCFELKFGVKMHLAPVDVLILINNIDGGCRVCTIMHYISLISKCIIKMVASLCIHDIFIFIAQGRVIPHFADINE